MAKNDNHGTLKLNVLLSATNNSIKHHLKIEQNLNSYLIIFSPSDAT
jgi:hypothetical protein